MAASAPTAGPSLTGSKKDVKWADGQPFTANDVVFTYEYVTDKAMAAPTLGFYLDLDRVEAIDPLTLRLTFKEPTGGWYVPFTGTSGVIVPRQALQNHLGADARNAEFNVKAFGTGPFMVTDFKPGDLVLMTANPYYREPGKPFFSGLQIKGGGDAVSAGRAVLETGECDFAYNLQVEAQVLGQLLKGGKGDLVTGPGGSVEQIWFNMADPNTEIDGERSSPRTRHPFLTDQQVRQAMTLAIDRSTMAKQLYGDTGDATANILTAPTSMNSPNTTVEFNIDKANQILDQSGYRRGGNGVRVTPEGIPTHVLFQTTTNSLRQTEQALVKDGWQKIGIDTELKSIDSSAFFSSDPANPDTNWHFYTDVEMSTVPLDSAFPLRYMRYFYGAVPERDWSQKSNNWTGANVLKWSNSEYNQLFDEVAVQTDPEQSGRIFIRINDALVNSYAVVPLVARKSVDAKSKALRGPVRGPFDSYSWNIADWTRE